MNAPNTNGDNCSAGAHQNSGTNGGVLALVRRLLHRERSPGLMRANSLKSVLSSESSGDSRPAPFLTQDLPNTMEVPRTHAQPPSPAALHKAIQTPAPNDSQEMPAEFMAMVEKLKGLFTPDLPNNIGSLSSEVEASLTPKRREAAQDRDSAAEPKTEPMDNLSMPSESVAVRSVGLPAKGAIARSRPAYLEIETNLKNHAEQFERHPAPLSTAAGSVSASLQQLQADAAVATFSERLDSEKQRSVAETQQSFEELRAAGQAFVDDAQKQLAATLQCSLDSVIKATLEKLGTEKQRFVAETQQRLEELRALRQTLLEDTQEQFATTQASLDTLIKTAVEKTCAELNTSKQKVMEESQKQSALVSRASNESVTKDLIDQVRAEVTASQHALIRDTQYQLNIMTRSSLQALQTLGRTCVEQVNADLMVSRKTFIDETRKQLVSTTHASLESLVNSSVEQGRRELSRMVNEFLAKSVPQIEAELIQLVNRYSVHTQFTRRRITDGY